MVNRAYLRHSYDDFADIAKRQFYHDMQKEKRMKTLTKAALAAALAMTTSLAASADTQNRIQTAEAAHWAPVDLNNVVIYDQSMRSRYLVTFTEECAAMHNGKGGRLVSTHPGVISGAFRDRMIFGRDACYIADVAKLNREELADLMEQRDVQFAATQIRQ